MSPLLPVLIPSVLVLGALAGTISVRDLMHKRVPLWLRVIMFIIAIVVMVIGIMGLVTGLQHLYSNRLEVPAHG